MEKKTTTNVKNALKLQVKKLQARWRKVITGSSEKRVRDHLKEAQEKPKYVKLLDKVAFTLGVLNIVACQYFLLNVPEYFPSWFTVVMPIMMISRFYHFKSLHWQYFMIDFCYLTILCSLINVLLVRSSPVFFKVCFIFSTGVLPIAIPVWRNSLIFHDFDKIISVYIHILPCMLYYTLRWHGKDQNSCQMATCSPLRSTDYLWALLLYCIWQTAYLIKTEVLDCDKFNANPQLTTSLRYISKDTKNAVAVGILKGLRVVGVFRKDEGYDSATIKTKLVFVGSQLVVTLISFLPTPLFYYSNMAHLLWIALIFTISIFNGASFYIEVFSVRYQKHLSRLEEMQRIAQETTKIVRQLTENMDNPTEMKKETSADSVLSNEDASPLCTPPEDDEEDEDEDGELLNFADVAGYEADLLEIDS